MSRHFFPFSLLVLSFWWGCQNTSAPVIDEVYRAEIETWRAERLASLKAADGWTTLAGLMKLHPGINTFGSSPENDVVFNAGAPAKMGAIVLAGDSAMVQMEEGVEVRMGDKLVRRVALTVDSPLDLNYASLSWRLIERGGQYFIRLRDTLHPARFELEQIPQFPIDTQWRVRARFIPFTPPKKLPVRNVLDMDIEQICEGKLQFEKDGQTYELWTLDGGPDEYFLIFADLTSGEETYGGGRYLYVPRPDDMGYTIIDFNKAYNPPCVFTSYATCLLPPAQNRIEIAIRAGEKMYGEKH